MNTTRLVGLEIEYCKGIEAWSTAELMSRRLENMVKIPSIFADEEQQLSTHNNSLTIYLLFHLLFILFKLVVVVGLGLI